MWLCSITVDRFLLSICDQVGTGEVPVPPEFQEVGSLLLFLIMDSFVASLDETPTTPEVQEAVVTALVGAGFTNPEHLVGTADSVIGELAGWLAGPAGGLLKRTFRCAEDVSGAKRVKAAALTSSPQSGHRVSQVPSNLAAGSLLSLLGPDASAGVVASALMAGSIVVDLNDMLEKAAIKDLPYHLRPQPALFQLLAAANKSAQEAVPVRKAYTHVDLTHKDVLPLWMRSEAVGVTRRDLASLTDADTASLGALGRAFKGALEKPRYFRNMVQWSAVWHRYATAAVAMGQMTCHGAVTCKANVQAGGRRANFWHWPCSGFIYDELLRKSFATRAEWSDPSLDLMTAFGEVEKQVLEAARKRLLQTGLSRQQNQRNQKKQDANSRAKVGAEAEKLTIKASQELAKQQAQLETSMAAMSKDKGKVGGTDNGKERTKRQKKAEKFFDKQRHNIEKREKSRRSEW